MVVVVTAVVVGPQESYGLEGLFFLVFLVVAVVVGPQDSDGVEGEKVF